LADDLDLDAMMVAAGFSVFGGKAGDPRPRPPKQLRILRKLKVILEATSGYEGTKCFIGKSVITAKEAEDTMSILEAPRPIVGQGAGEAQTNRLEGWTLLVQGWPKDEHGEPSAPAYWMKAAVEQQLALIVAELPDGRQRKDSLYKLGGDIGSLTIGQGVVRPPSEEAASRLAMFYLPLILEITTDVRQPYA
jgi:hypothetical protein